MYVLGRHTDARGYSLCIQQNAKKISPVEDFNRAEELQERERAGVTELADAVGKAKSGVHAQFKILEANELVVNEGTTYGLSLRFLDMAESVKAQFGNYDVIASEIDALAAKTGEVVQFGAEEHGWLVYLYKSKGDAGVETASSIGKREHLHSTSLGKAILSTYAEEEVKQIIVRRGLPEKTENTITTRAELFEELGQTQDRGYAFDDEENISGLRCISVPVFQDEENVFSAVSVSGPSRRMTQERVEKELVDAVSKSANVIEINSRFS